MALVAWIGPVMRPSFTRLPLRDSTISELRQDDRVSALAAASS